ncbi:CvpA family protein [Paenirhodobacter populi]|uniref:CvpA family protein n=1 Tax=Paenirhodobacter populi TaxID=2306993 RepID=A0A443KMV8_9RHOB|nr:CvpA family protein [Sinirhodobacter populi]RWR09438.1 CvpA family protein [Sinirhodobacter populi]RWR12957.1 CvpA family protein [Sinirhodobacter populi]RWR20853.1 CvpA family protein [Sinirhodobacter populi]RWR29700.1 CvpA family protein [Sinirhodobacter populi]RWR34082.1 CvpA family protein [Sinirhodobacter populi]
MEGFTIVDAIVAVVIILSAILAYSRGFVREGLAIVGWIAAAVVAFMFASAARPLIAQLPFVNKFLGESCELATIGGFAAVFALALVVFSIITPLFASVVQRSALGGVDQALGFLFGALRGIILIAVAFVVYDRLMADEAVPVVDQSRSAQIFANFSNRLEQSVPTDAPGWIVARYEQLVSSCPAPNAPVDATTPVQE